MAQSEMQKPPGGSGSAEELDRGEAIYSAEFSATQAVKQESFTAGLSNALASAAEQIRAISLAADEAQKDAALKMIEAGKLLCAAKEECPHGAWGAFLERAGIHERKARRLMQLARSGLKSDTVSELGGLKAALTYIAKREEFAKTSLPQPGHVLHVAYDDPMSIDVKWPTGYVWEDPLNGGYYHVAAIDMESGFITMTRKPIKPEPISWGDDTCWPLWECLRQLMRHSPVDCYFEIVPDFVGMRQAIISFCHEDVRHG